MFIIIVTIAVFTIVDIIANLELRERSLTYVFFSLCGRLGLGLKYIAGFILAGGVAFSHAAYIINCYCPN